MKSTQSRKKRTGAVRSAGIRYARVDAFSIFSLTNVAYVAYATFLWEERAPHASHGLGGFRAKGCNICYTWLRRYCVQTNMFSMTFLWCPSVSFSDLLSSEIYLPRQQLRRWLNYRADLLLLPLMCLQQNKRCLIGCSGSHPPRQQSITTLIKLSSISCAEGLSDGWFSPPVKERNKYSPTC